MAGRSDGGDPVARTLYGRRRGHALRAGQSERMVRLLPQLRLDLGKPAPRDVGALFPRPVAGVHMEIGFGGGEHLTREALRSPDTGFIGCEPFENGVAKLLGEIEATGIDNVRVHDGDAADILDWLPPSCLDRIWLLYPDPWPKRRHRKRRFISPERLAALARVMRPGAELRFATDIDDYADWTLRHMRGRDDLDWTATCADDWRVPWPGWPGTRYEAKAVAAGRRPCYLTFRRR